MSADAARAEPSSAKNAIQMAESTRRISSACGRNGEMFDRALPPYWMERISISWSPTKTISPAALPIGARALGRRTGIRAECRQITLFEASFGFQCSAHSSDGEFPLEL